MNICITLPMIIPGGFGTGSLSLYHKNHAFSSKRKKAGLFIPVKAASVYKLSKTIPEP